MKALVTGGAGFIGSNLVDRLLEAGNEVTIIDDLSTGALANLEPAIERGARFVRGDIRDQAQVGELVGDRPEVIFHLAAQMDVRVSVADPVFDGEVNILGTINLLEAARGSGSRLVFASTGGAIYGEGNGRELPFAEDAPPRPDAPYGQSKLSAEGYCGLYRRLYGVDTVALRLGNVYGPRQNPHGEAGVIAMFCGRLVKQQPVTVFGDGAQTRDYVYVDDVVDALLAAAESEREGPYNVGTGARDERPRPGLVAIGDLLVLRRPRIRSGAHRGDHADGDQPREDRGRSRLARGGRDRRGIDEDRDLGSGRGDARKGGRRMTTSIVAGGLLGWEPTVERLVGAGD